MIPEHPTVALARELLASTPETIRTVRLSRDEIRAICDRLILLQAVADAARDRIESHGRYGECLCSLCAAFHKLDGAPKGG